MSGLPGDAPVNDERQVSLESIPGSGFPGYWKAQIQ